MHPRWLFIAILVVFPAIVWPQNAPVTTASTIFNAFQGIVTVPVTVANFTDISAFSLDLEFDPSVLTFVQGTKNSSLSGSFIIGDNLLPSGKHHLVISWFGTASSLPDGASLVDIKFNYLNGTSDLTWLDDGSSCEYADYQFNALNDMPTACYYTNGLVTAGKCLNLTVFIEGLYDPTSHKMNSALGSIPGPCTDRIADKITVELHNAYNYSIVEQVIGDVDLSVHGLASVLIQPSLVNSYYITVKHHNSIKTVSAMPVSFSAGTISYNFTNAISKAYGNNMINLGDGTWSLFSGDVNQDGIVDSGDMLLVDNASLLFSTGYLPEDCNGDGIIDSSDMIILDNNATAFVTSIIP
jgi:hypothetical protein